MFIINNSIKLAFELFPEAYSNLENRNWHFAFAYKRNKLISIGKNNMKCQDGVVLKYVKKFGGGHRKYLSRHAEIDLIHKMYGRYNIDRGISIVVIRVNKDNKLCNSKPCEKCLTILKALDVQKIYYSTQNGDVVKL